MSADDAELIADGSDATRVVFRALDRYGAPRPYVGGDVAISADGPATLVGESTFSFADAGGGGAVDLMARQASPGARRRPVWISRSGSCRGWWCRTPRRG